jgi:tripartite-type tricarboxylate transporter receptor subunit TctC
MRKFFILPLLALAMAATATLARAQESYPDKIITLIVPFAAGGPTDTVGRLIAQAMSAALKQQVIVENIGGAGGTIGAARAAKASPDGYTLLLTNTSFATSGALYRKLTFDPQASFEPIGLVNEAPMTLVARKNFPAKTLAEVIDYAKTNGHKVTFANAGLSGASHLCGMLFMAAIDTKLTTVSYKGTGPAMNDLVGGQVDLMCDQTTNTTNQIKAGTIAVYGVTTKTRVPALPDVPTMDEAGLPGLELVIWHGLYAPKGTPEPIIAKLSAALQTALQDPVVIERFAALGTVPVARESATPEALRARLASEINKWTPIIKAAGVYAD